MYLFLPRIDKGNAFKDFFCFIKNVLPKKPLKNMLSRMVMADKPLMMQLAVIFVIAQILGLAVAVNFIKEDVRADLITEDPEDVENALGLFAYILVFTLIFLIVIRFVKGWFFFKAIEGLAVFGTSYIVFAVFLPEIAFMFAVIMVVIRNVFRQDIWLKKRS